MSLIVDIEKNLGNFHLRSKFETSDGTMALLGASGCGKSVTLKCIAGIMTPDRGRIILDGETLFDSEKHINLVPQKRQVGYLFQQYALFSNMTVLQNIMCGIRSGSKAEKISLATDQLKRFRLDGLEKKFPAQLSGGQQQRVALARIMASKPRAILLDEPFSALDSFLKWHLELEMSNLLSDFTGPILWVSHDLGECYRNCENVCVMEDGKSSPVIDMKSMAHHPTTLGAARLAGYRNFLPSHPAEDGIVIDGWNISLNITDSNNAPDSKNAALTLAIPDGGIKLGEGPHKGEICRIIHDLGNSVVLLRNPEESTAPLLRAILPEGMQAGESDTVYFTILEDQCLSYRQ